MKKIGIMTLYGDYNIGNKLQNYAVQTFFEEMGFECRTLRHWEMARRPFTFRTCLKKGCEIIGYPKEKATELRLETKRTKRFKAFSKQYLKLGEHVKIAQLPKNLAERYNYFVVGSDQVWHNWTKSEKELCYFLLKFAKSEQRLTIAPSFGKIEIENEFQQSYADGLKGFDRLSCREQVGAELIKNLTGQEAVVLADPTMLIEKLHWEKMERRPVGFPEDKYILVYSLGGLTEEASRFVEQTSACYQLKVIDILKMNIPEYYMTTPDEFLYYIDRASLVVTDSFHACVFSILYKTDFTVFNRSLKTMGNMTSRLDTLLSKFSLGDRKLEYVTSDSIFDTDFSMVEHVLQAEKDRAKNFYSDMII